MTKDDSTPRAERALDKHQAAKLIAVWPELSEEQREIAFGVCGPNVRKLVEDAVEMLTAGLATRLARHDQKSTTVGILITSAVMSCAGWPGSAADRLCSTVSTQQIRSS